jgi:hypothetical protein
MTPRLRKFGFSKTTHIGALPKALSPAFRTCIKPAAVSRKPAKKKKKVQEKTTISARKKGKVHEKD